jgi:hypothetical protein
MLIFMERNSAAIFKNGQLADAAIAAMASYTSEGDRLKAWCGSAR